ncbi:MAG TPA: Ig domain-containing protein [Candidatus Binatia bacterium]|jgi:hypothetical protein
MFYRARQLIRRYSWFVLFFALLEVTIQATRLPHLFAADGVAQGIEDGAEQSGDVYEQGVPWRGAPGITETVEEIMAREAQRRSAADSAVFAPRPRKPLLKGLPKTEGDSPAPEVSQWPAANSAPRTRPVPSPRNPQTIGTSFLGVDSTEPGCNCVPPDSMGAVGPTQVLVATNNRIKVFNKAGVLGGLNTDTDSFFASVGGNVNGTSDPHVRYDRLSGRWFVTIIDLDNVNNILIAVSSGSTITNLSSFTFFSFQNDQVGPTPNVDTGLFADYDTLGVDKFALYVGVNMFNGNFFTGTTAFVINKADLLANTLTVTAFRHVAGNTCPSTGLFTPQGVHNDDPNATTGYFIGVDVCTFNKLVLRRVSNPGGTPSISGNLTLAVPTTTSPIDQVQPSPGPNLDALDDRLYAASIHTNAITGAKTLWTAHNIQVNSAGVGSNLGGRNGSRWYQIGNLSGTPNLIQSGTLFDSAASTPFGYWIPSVAMSGQGHMAIAASRASANASTGFAGIVAAGRLRTDALGTTQAPTLAQSSTFSYDTFVVGTERWGDYSQVGVDPNDNMTMWTFQEYASATDTWGVRAIKLVAAPPATPASASPAAVEVGQASVDVTIDGTSVSGSEFFDPGPDTGGPGFNRLSASVTGGVVVNSVTFVSPTRITLNLDTTGASQGTWDVTITNPDGQFLTAVGLLSISPDVPPMTLSTSPLPVAEVAVAYSEPLVTGGLPPYTITKTGGSYPAGLTPNVANGMLEGTPTVPALLGKFFTVRITDQLGASLKRRFKIVVKKAITITTSSLPTGTSGHSYSKTLAASGGKAPRTWTEESGNLPAGLSLAPATGVISGIPAAPTVAPVALTFKVVDVLGGEDQKVLSLTIN